MSDRLRSADRAIERFVIAVIWILPVMAFTTPTSTRSSSWQPLDSIKLMVLGLVCAIGPIMVLRGASHRNFHRVVSSLMPFYAFLAWALVSVLWSAIVSVTISQSGSLAALLLLATATGLVVDRAEMAGRLLGHINGMLLLCSGVVLLAYLINPELSGLTRDRIHTGGDGLIHPTAAGATASLGLLLPVLGHFIGRYVWAARWMLACFLIHGIVLLLSNSRMAMLMGGITIFAVVFYQSTNLKRAWAMVAGGVMLMAVVVADPGFRASSSTADVGVQFVSRGQSQEQLKGVSGRAELWSAIWEEYKKSPIIGHGYFVTSEAGELYIWHQWTNQTAHNLMLQILSTTGVIGVAIFLVALVQPLAATLSIRRGGPAVAKISTITLVTAFWYLGWAQLGVSFMGPIRPESILFFTLVGMVIGLNAESVVSGQSSVVGSR